MWDGVVVGWDRMVDGGWPHAHAMQRFLILRLLRVGRGQEGAESWADVPFERCSVQYSQYSTVQYL